MILSVSRRTDVPAYFGDWFINRLKGGEVYVRNPMNSRQVSKIPLSPDKIECIVFWTKNPAEKFISDLDIVSNFGYKYYFQFSITPYNELIEKNIPRKKIIIDRFQRLSKKIGKEKVVWRYDPIFVNDYYSIDYHIKYFDYIANELKSYTEKCIISFIDIYSKIKNRLCSIGINEMTLEQMQIIAREFSKIAKKYDLKIETCCEDVDLSLYDIEHGHCVDVNLVNYICGKEFEIKKDKGQRKQCGCAESVDIGNYNTCGNGCVYCYAAWNDVVSVDCDIDSPILCSKIMPEDKVTERIVMPCGVAERKLF